MLFNTFLGGFIAHALTILPWLLGGVLALFPVILIGTGRALVATVLACLLSAQYVVDIKPWPQFARFLKDLNPRAFYRRCTLGGNIESIASSKTLLAYHPHGMLCAGFSWNGSHAPELEDKGITFLVVDMLCNAPLFGWVVGWLGNIQGASAKNMTGLMSTGANLGLIPGGEGRED